MAGGLRYMTGREMPAGMQEIYARKLLGRWKLGPGSGEEEAENPCGTCVRWSECNGVDKENCPLWGENKTKER